MRLYNFARLIQKYSVSCQLVTTANGAWSAGKYTEGETATAEINGAVVPISIKRIMDSGGFYKQGDCEFITTETIEITDKTYLVHNGERYKLENSTDYSDYADFNIYVARGVSAFDTTGTSTAGRA